LARDLPRESAPTGGREAICEGHQPAELSAEALLERFDLPLEWPLQLKAVGLDKSLR
jgi:hypothetical protein